MRDAIEELEQALSQILHERDEQWEQRLEEQEAQVERPERSDEPVADAENVGEGAEREPEQRIEIEQPEEVIDAFYDILDHVDTYLNEATSSATDVAEALEASEEELTDDLEQLRGMGDVLNEQLKRFERIRDAVAEREE
jgi:thiamine pyrophosphate-dependent acetolactate synthase large subunit-like protein